MFINVARYWLLVPGYKISDQQITTSTQYYQPKPCEGWQQATSTLN